MKKYILLNNQEYDIPQITNIPGYVEKENQNGGYISYGYNNLYPEHLKELMNKSSKHSAIVKGKAAMIGGNGWSDNGLSFDAQNFLGNPYGVEDLDVILSKCAYDNELYGGFALNIIWSKDRSKIARINYLDPSKIRIAIPKLLDNSWDDVEDYWYCDDWRSTRKYKPILMKGFSVDDREEASQILYVKDYRPGTEWYAQPEYLPAINWIELEWEISQFHLSNVKNGFYPSVSINFCQGVPSDEEQDYFVKELKKQFAGAKNAGEPILTFSEGKDNAPIITPINSNTSDEKFIQLNNEVTDGIMLGHRVTNPILFGQKVPGELGGSTKEIVDAMRTFQAMYVDTKQNMIEKIFNRLARVNGIKDELKINKHQIELDINIVPTDILAIIQATITPEQKHNIFLAMGYSEEMANNLVGQPINQPTINQSTIKQEIQQEINDNIKNLTGRQLQNIERLKRKCKNGSMSMEQAKMLLRTGYGLSDEEATLMLQDIQNIIN